MSENKGEVVNPQAKKIYHTPELLVYGTIVQLTETKKGGIGMDNPGADPSKSFA